ncbi:4-aminobutyrate--2-oxoglutarate transaminase [Aquincola sp. S2]|uniref:4-aminobutyrate--2-oxoglutarate transaminase n=1 Tax=Pseudaquabacterium terrae TaxID=2732868 RepID=A0ABX2EGU9_9BURK|nr:4-aminobutyrate--2-oxoglutarate transaminase [Aquabacterium terrae]NRF67811.1 4-aminobutyrate--2-oxoglutarate transaminase [Aquabacterium terrae]
MSINQQLQARKEAATPRGVAVFASFFAARARNAELWDVEGRRYIDFAGGIGVLNTGHRHPRVMQAVQAQLERFTHTAYQVVPTEGYVALAERLNEVTPGMFHKKTALFTTGAEAVENAIKIARAHTGRPGVIALSGGFHGRTYLGMALTGKVNPYKKGFGPFPGSIYHVPAPMALHGVTVEDTLFAIDTLFKSDIDPRQVAAIIVEPVQGEGGFHVMPETLMLKLREICDAHSIVLIADEVQSGFARTGLMFAMHHHPVQPDLITMAKSLAGGLPLSAVTGRAEIMDAAEPGGLGGTYAGNPLAVAAAHAVLDVIDEENLCERAEQLGSRLRSALETVAVEYPVIAEVRGLGSMLAIEFLDPETRRPLPEVAKRVQARALLDGLLLLTCGSHGNVIRFLYPLTIENAIFDEALSALCRALVD